MSDFGPDENRLIIKVCGMRESENIRAVAALPVDWMGFIFYEKSPRFVRRKPDVDFGTARPKRVGVFVNEKIPAVLARVSEYGLDAVQLHGDESPEYCAWLRKVWPQIQIVKVFSVGSGFDFAQTVPFEGVCDWFLFDTKGENRGGNGRTFDWSILENYTGKVPFLLSGGIGPAHAEAIAACDFPQLVGVDLNSGFEVEPGVKDAQKLAAFVRQLRALNGDGKDEFEL